MPGLILSLGNHWHVPSIVLL